MGVMPVQFVPPSVDWKSLSVLPSRSKGAEGCWDTAKAQIEGTVTTKLTSHPADQLAPPSTVLYMPPWRVPAQSLF